MGAAPYAFSTSPFSLVDTEHLITSKLARKRSIRSMRDAKSGFFVGIRAAISEGGEPRAAAGGSGEDVDDGELRSRLQQHGTRFVLFTLILYFRRS
uniref:O-methyltransferase n=1 Tax=Rhizophora mucronata TaxID=61149 RepID=A0A2P2LGK9_RHIMU